MENDITYVGKVIRVDSNSVEVEIDEYIPSGSPIISGKVYKIGQIGTFIKIVSGSITTYGLVESVSNTSSKTDLNTSITCGSRYLTVNLVGEKIGSHPFEKGVGLYPTVNDEVHIVTESDLENLYGAADITQFPIGKHASSDNLDVFVDVHKLVLRHTAILGSTGSGKSNTTVAVLKQIIGGYSNSRIVLIDPHGEYSSAFPSAKVFRIGDSQNPLYIPFWLMNFDELAYFLVGAKSNEDNTPAYRQLREMITNFKKQKYNLLDDTIDENLITADSPIPFSAHQVWHTMNWLLNATFSSSKKDEQTAETAMETDPGDPETLKPATFEPYAMGNKPPFKSASQEYYGYEKKLLSRLKDSRYDFMFSPGEYGGKNPSKDLYGLLQDWIGSPERLTILDLSNVPFEVLDIAVGLITRFIYDSMFWGRYEPYTGKNRPLFLVYEEAHTYLDKGEHTKYAKSAVEKIFKEGRKFGLGAMVISQRPSEISETILAQIGTFIALRLTNSTDQSIVKSLAPDNMNSLMSLLPSLRIGEAVVVGEAIKIPSRIRIKPQNPRPDSADPRLVEAWSRQFEAAESYYKPVVHKLRQQKI